ncbi:hypothetical protein VP1G_11093 [Cytospora mali]|uniref:Uncharacterized protein n=1 Tax=Cytospora mali TaxID=578113 RepID=A0A194V7C6_CYTMA|nr:hypothetical protein VP1G_11093 [Valsa mali var. pyri (nom. inval.)]
MNTVEMRTLYETQKREAAQCLEMYLQNQFAAARAAHTPTLRLLQLRTFINRTGAMFQIHHIGANL